MRRISTMIWIFVIVVAAFLLYQVKYAVQSLKGQIADTTHQLEEEKAGLHVAAAEWAYLNRPDRLRQLAAKYLSSGALTVNQVSEIETIPFPGQSIASRDGEEGLQPVSIRTEEETGADSE